MVATNSISESESPAPRKSGALRRFCLKESDRRSRYATRSDNVKPPVEDSPPERLLTGAVRTIGNSAGVSGVVGRSRFLFSARPLLEGALTAAE